MRRFRLFAFTATAATYFLIFVGGLVRVSGAGLGCPDWPTCFGRWFPPTDIIQLPPDIDPARFNFVLAWIEYINRLIGVAVGILIAVTAVWALLRFRKYPRIVVPAVLAGVLVAYQGWQGGRMIEAHLESYLVSVHMGLAFVIAILMTYLTQHAYFMERDVKTAAAPQARQSRPWLVGLGILSIVQVVLGTQVRTALEQVGERFPLLSESRWLEQVGSISIVHTILGVLVTLVTWQVGATILKRIERPAPEIIHSTWMLIILATAQVVIGGILYVAGVPDVMRLFHLLISALYIGVLVLLFPALRHQSPPEPRPGPAGRLRWIIPVLAFVVFLGITVNWAADTSRGKLPVLGQVPEFEMTSHTGEPFGRDEMLGRIAIVDFFFTSCPGICPVLNGNMAELYRALEGSDQVQFVSISVDPDRDSLAALRAYADGWGVDDDRWIFLRAPVDYVIEVAEKGFMLPADNLPMSHTTRFTLVDPQGRIRGYYNGLDQGSVTLLRDHLRRLAGELP